MKIFLIVIMLSLSVMGFAQHSQNRFEEEPLENTDNSTGHTGEDQIDESQSRDGNPADPVPIDNYIPVLLMTAIGIIIYTTQKKKKLLSRF